MYVFWKSDDNDCVYQIVNTLDYNQKKCIIHPLGKLTQKVFVHFEGTMTLRETVSGDKWAGDADRMSVI